MHEQDFGNYGNKVANDVARGGSTLMGFVCGVAVGAGIALLLAPASGEETRRRLRETASRLQDDAQERIGHAKDVAKDKIGQARDMAKDKIGQARGTLNEITEDAKAAFDTGREAYSRTRQERAQSTVPSA